MARDFQTLRNLLYYPDSPKRLFFFNTLTYQTGYDNDEYINEAFHIAAEGYHYLTNNILTDPNGLLTKGSQNYIEKMESIKKFLQVAIETQQKNEMLYFRNMIITLKQKFNDLPMPESVQNLITFFELAEKNGIFDYEEYIIRVNEILQGTQVTEASINYEAERLEKLDNAYSQIKREIAEQIVGGAVNFSSLSKKTQNILMWRAGNELNIRYMTKGHISGGKNSQLPIIDDIIEKIMKKVPQTADNKIAEFTSQLTEQLFSSSHLRQEILKKINQYYNKQIPNLEQAIRKEIVLQMQVWGKQHTKELLNGIAEAPSVAKIEAEVVASLANLQGLYQFEINNLPPVLVGTKGLAFFNDSKKTKKGQRSGEKLYEAIKQFSNEINATQQLTQEQQSIAKTLKLKGKGSGNSKNKKILTQISKLESLQQMILERAITLQGDEKELQIQIKDIINQIGNNNQKAAPIDGIITVKVDKNGKIILTDNNNKILSKILKENGYINSNSMASKTLDNFISSMKGKASKMFKETLQRNVIKIGDQELLNIFYRHLNTVKINISGATRNELMAGIELIQKNNGELDLYFGGTKNNKNDFIVISVDPGARELQKQFSIAYKDLMRSQCSTTFQSLYQQKIKAIEDFQQNFVQDMQNMKKKNIYHDYQAKAKAFFNRYNQHTKRIKQIYSQYEKLDGQFSKLRKNMRTQAQQDEKTDKKVKRILNQLKKSLTQTIYRSDTMKSYNEYNNKIGFLGGSIGINLEEQLQTINQLFEQGGMGLSSQQMDYLTDIIINTSYESIIGTQYEATIERYFSAVAAFALFDEGGAEMEILQNTISNNNKKLSSPKILHMYRLDNLYYPGSYILKETLAGVMELGKVMTVNTHGARVKIINKTNLNIIPNNLWNPGEPVDEYPWETVSAYALQHTNLQITFMAGMLQILTNLQKRMKDILIPA